MSIITSLPEVAAPTTPTTPTPAEPEILRRERAAFREILRLVAERAAQRRPSSARLSGLRATTPAKGNCSGKSRAIRKKNSARQPLPMIPKEWGMASTF